MKNAARKHLYSQKQDVFNRNNIIQISYYRDFTESDKQNTPDYPFKLNAFFLFIFFKLMYIFIHHHTSK